MHSLKVDQDDPAQQLVKPKQRSVYLRTVVYCAHTHTHNICCGMIVRTALVWMYVRVVSCLFLVLRRCEFLATAATVCRLCVFAKSELSADGGWCVCGCLVVVWWLDKQSRVWF